MAVAPQVLLTNSAYNALPCLYDESWEPMSFSDIDMHSGLTNNPVTIMIVDDDRVDTMAIRRSFRALQISNPVVAAKDGVEALECLRGENGKEKVKPPFLILLDLNTPRMGGLEFLDALRRDTDLQQTLVFVMTTSSGVTDRIQAYAKNVAGYVLKYRAGNDFQDAIAMLEHYWGTIEFPVDATSLN